MATVAESGLYISVSYLTTCRSSLSMVLFNAPVLAAQLSENSLMGDALNI